MEVCCLMRLLLSGHDIDPNLYSKFWYNSIVKLSKQILVFLVLSIFFTAVILCFFRYIGIPYLNFSDGAKFADLARNILSGLGYNGSFAFWDSNILGLSKGSFFPSIWTPPLMPLSIAVFFKIFGISDISVIATSLTFFFLTIIFTYLLGKKLFGNLVGFLAAISMIFNETFIHYGTSGASEPLFTFEIIVTAYLLTLKKKWTTVIGFIFMIIMYFTRPQAFIYIVGLILYWLLTTFKNKKAIKYFIGIIILGLLMDKLILSSLSGKYFLYPIIGRGAHALVHVTAVSSSTDTLRGIDEQVTVISIFKKIFYNLYNLYKLLPQIASPYLWTLFLVGIFHWSKNKIFNAFKISAIFMITLTFLVTAFSIPLFRYIHPVIPLVYLISIETLVWIIRKIADEIIKGDKKKFVIIVSGVLVSIFCVGQTSGVILLDSRFNSKLINKNKPPVYVTLSKILKENTNSDQLILTNLDTWGSWYGDRKTIWYPVTPDMIIPSSKQENSLDAIYLTSYLTDDENYYMGEEWKQIFLDPKNIKNEYISKNYKFKASFDIKAEDVYENYSAKAVLLVHK